MILATYGFVYLNLRICLPTPAYLFTSMHITN
nr:MAG TPA: hypothetical protein [Caudoviricetes sp.]